MCAPAFRLNMHTGNLLGYTSIHHCAQICDRRNDIAVIIALLSTSGADDVQLKEPTSTITKVLVAEALFKLEQLNATLS